MSRIIKVEHLARVEGHGGITVELDHGTVKKVNFDIFEGPRLLEGLLRGRDYRDVSQIISRICAICSAAHSLTSIKATENAFGVQVTPQTERLRDLLYRGESIESHALHVFCLAVPDYLNYPSVVALAADHPEAALLGLRLKKLGNTIQEIVGGRAVHPVNAIVGGFGRVPDTDQLITMRNDLTQGMSDCKAMMALLASLPPADFCHTDTAYAAVRSPGDYGYYAGDEIVVMAGGQEKTFPASEYRSVTNEQTVAHSHAKHSTFEGSPFMVGSLARLLANKDKLSASGVQAIEELKLELPADNPMDNNKAQAIELLHDVEYALNTVNLFLANGLIDQDNVPVTPRAGTGTAVTEAPRGILVHSYDYDEEGKIVAADVITPTAMNAASVENHFRCAVEQGKEDETPVLKRKLEMIARAYDPCVSCSVHLIENTR